jgi:hypothetical protein
MIVRVNRRKLNPVRERDSHKRYVVPVQSLSFTCSRRGKSLRSEYIDVFLESEIQPLGIFGTTLTNLFIRLYHNFPFHSLPQCVIFIPIPRTGHESVTRHPTILPLCVTVTVHRDNQDTMGVEEWKEGLF